MLQIGALHYENIPRTEYEEAYTEVSDVVAPNRDSLYSSQGVFVRAVRVGELPSFIPHLLRHFTFVIF
jgi:hypothetical protein